MAHEFTMGEWAKGKEKVWETVCEKYGGDKEAFNWGTWGFFDWSLGKAWPTVGTTTKAREYGWQRYDDTFKTWIQTFRNFENAGTLPRQRTYQLKALPGTSLPLEGPTKVNGDAAHDTEQIRVG